jgi:hypothetical protein
VYADYYARNSLSWPVVRRCIPEGCAHIVALWWFLRATCRRRRCRQFVALLRQESGPPGAIFPLTSASVVCGGVRGTDRPGTAGAT